MGLWFPVEPMKATLGRLPADSDERWAFEIKWDGYRTLAFVDGDRLRLQSSSGIDVTATYPELADLPTAVNAGKAVLDAELVVLDDDGSPRFELVQQHTRPAALYLFDVLRIDDHDTISLDYLSRRRLLESMVEPGDHHLVPSHRVGDGEALYTATAERGLEGIMAKLVDSTYLPGKRSKSWRKVKHRRQIDVTIGGFTRGEGGRASTFGSLLVGRPDGDRLAFAGGIGTGFDDRLLAELTATLSDLQVAECPFDPPPPAMYRKMATWVEPVLRARVEMTELTNDGYVRHGSFIQLLG